MSQENNKNTLEQEIAESKVFKHNGFECEFDLTDADTVELYENVFDEMGKKEKELPKTGKHSEIIRAHFNWIVETFDKLFGEGAGKKICGEKPSLSNAYDAYDVFLDYCARQKAAQIERGQRINSTYLNRAQRRANAKVKK